MYSIASSRYLNSLEELEIKGYNLDDGSISALTNMVRSSNTTKLKCLKLTKGKNEATEKLYSSFQQYLGKIEHLCVVGLTDNELEKWKKTFKKCNIEHNDRASEAS
jgi:fatty acid-binding protein DegV